MPSPEVHQHIWNAVYKAVEQLSPTQTAVIGGVGSTASAVSVLSASDGAGMAGLQYFTVGMGAVGAVLSCGLLLLKFVQQRREMAKWREENKSEHKRFTTAHRESAEDRQELHEQTETLADRVNNIEDRCALCGFRRQPMKEGD